MEEVSELLRSPGTLPPSLINEILKHIPHRFPFLLVDRMEACEPGKWVRAIKNVTRSEPMLRTIRDAGDQMPELLVVEALAQASGVLCHYSGMTSLDGKTLVFFAGIESCNIHRPARSGEVLTLICQMRRAMRGVAKIAATAFAGEEVLITADLTAVVRDRSELAA